MVHTHMPMCTYAHAYVPTCPCVHTHMPMHPYPHAHAYIPTCPCIHTHMPMRTYPHAHAYIPTCPCVHAQNPDEGETRGFATFLPNMHEIGNLFTKTTGDPILKCYLKQLVSNCFVSYFVTWSSQPPPPLPHMA